MPRVPRAQVLSWINTLINSALADGRLCGSPTGGDGRALQLSLNGKLMDLRAAYASIADQLCGRMPLAYTQLVQILVDILVVVSPFALLSAVTPVQAVMGTGMLTLFYTGVLNLAKVSSSSLTLIL